VEKLLLPPFQKDSIKILHSKVDEYYISGYAVIPKDNYTLEQVRNFLESPYCYDIIKDKAKSMSSGWIGLSKNTFNGIKIPNRFFQQTKEK
jgi:hypothetical protein